MGQTHPDKGVLLQWLLFESPIVEEHYCITYEHIQSPGLQSNFPVLLDIPVSKKKQVNKYEYPTAIRQYTLIHNL